MFFKSDFYSPGHDQLFANSFSHFSCVMPTNIDLYTVSQKKTASLIFWITLWNIWDTVYMRVIVIA